MSDVDLDAIRDAERTLYRAKLRHLEQVALTALAERPGLTLTPLWPPSVVIQIVALDGVHLGRVRRDGPPGDNEHWFAVPPGPRRGHGPYPSAHAAAQALHLPAVPVHSSRPRAGTRSSDTGGSP